MKNLITLLIIGLLSTSCGGSSDNSQARNKTTNSTVTQWYEGGTLHKAKIAEWKTATDKNKLSTCGDFMAIVDNSVSMDILKIRAEDLKLCIDEATKGLDSTNNEAVSTIAALCIKQMEY
ncbi:hypothetical protein SAMN05443667_11525 [Flavobacterium gillisiae]|jgi:hypothetical protein|uniref:Lipoprotein n=1 Tax=Flavobacterium gillisiae TaxID=150146 RepID=A0A1H4FUQ4_9FLAO|nr:hypothetical protein [Flavobacterium gillisiae]SEB01014.1 hypothetical protein SAMN05443667_11525 [Flavobacterium gillisiae]